jgi:glycosyltransferase involved in cell wall biosynthesis
MKVLFVYQFCSLGGCETVLRNRLLGFRARGLHPRVVLLKDVGGRRLFAEFDEVTCPCSADELERIIAQGSFDCVAALDTPQVYPALEEARFSGAVVTEVHTNRLANMQYLRDLQTTPTRAVITPSRFEADLIEREFPNVTASGVPIRIVPNPVDTRLFRPSPPAVLLAQPWVGWVGRLEREKNWQHFLEIAGAVARVRPDAGFLLIGGGLVVDDVKKELLARIRAHGLIDRIRWVSALDYEAMSRFYALLAASGGCLLATSLAEPFGMSIVEAMASGCPVAAARAGAFRELIRDRRTGVTFTPDDTSAATASVLELLENGTLRARVVEGGLEMVSATFTPERVVERYLDVVAQAVVPPATAGAGLG